MSRLTIAFHFGPSISKAPGRMVSRRELTERLYYSEAMRSSLFERTLDAIAAASRTPTRELRAIMESVSRKFDG